MNIVDRIARAVEARLLAEMATDGPEYDAQYDRALEDAHARGLGYDEAHLEAARIADVWKATWKAAQP